MTKRIYVLEFAAFDSPVTYYFSSKKKANSFARRYVGRYEWSLSSYKLDPRKVSRDDEMWFVNTKRGKTLKELEDKDRTKWMAAEAKKTSLDKLMERLDAHISVNSTNPKQDIETLKSLKKEIKKLVKEKGEEA